jgi:nitrogen fixation NifU-like protein
LSEGSAVTKPCKGRVFFTFGSHEIDYINDVKNIIQQIFALSANKIRQINNSANIVFSSARLARFFEKHFGKGAQNKHLPHWMLLLPLEKQAALLCGLWRGDGYINQKKGKFVTISKTLAHQVKILLMRQKIVFSFLTVPQQGIHKENYCIYIVSKEAKARIADIVGKNIKVAPRLKNTQKSWYDDDYFYTTIDKIDEVPYKGTVYNLEVEDSHSYVSEAVTLHNCGDIMELYIKVRDDIIVDAKFKTFGCGAAISTSSMITELVKGKALKDAVDISNRAVVEALGGLPKIKMHCSVLAEQALHSAIRDYLTKRNRLSEFPKLKDIPADGMDHNHDHGAE